MSDASGSIQQINHAGQPALSLQAADGSTCLISLFGAQVL